MACKLFDEISGKFDEHVFAILKTFPIAAIFMILARTLKSKNFDESEHKKLFSFRISLEIFSDPIPDHPPTPQRM